MTLKEADELKGGNHMRYRIVRYYNGTKGYGRKFDTEKEAREFIATDSKIQQYIEDGFSFDVEETEE